MDYLLYDNLGKCIRCVHSDTSAYGLFCSICDRNVDSNGNCLDFELDMYRHTTSQKSFECEVENE